MISSVESDNESRRRPKETGEEQTPDKNGNMAGAEVDMEAISDMDTDELRETLTTVYDMFRKQSIQIAGVKGLVRQLSEKREEVERLKSKCEFLEAQLARAENRVGQLNLASSNGNGTSSQGATVMPSVSRKVLETLTRDNVKLRMTLEHMSKKDVDGLDLTVENRELHEIIIALRTERDAKRTEVQELKRAIALMPSEGADALKDQIISLTEELATAKRNLESKQVFCERTVIENEGLKEKLSSLGDVTERITDVGRLKAAVSEAANSQPEMRELMDRVWDGTGEMNPERRDRFHEELMRSRKAIKENVGLVERLNQEIADLWERNQEISDGHEDATRKLTAELENARRERDYVREELIKSRETVDNQKREVERIAGEHTDLQAKFQELTHERLLMQSALESYVNDFKKEHEDRRKIEQSRQTLQQELDRVAREHGDLQRRYRGLAQRVRDSFSMPSYRRGGCDDVVDAPETTRPDPQRNELQCPTCEQNFPCWLLEDHMRDCEGVR